MTRSWIVLLTAAALFLSASASSAQSGSDSNKDGNGGQVRASFAGSLGFLADDPGGVNLGFEAPIEFTKNFSVGPWVAVSLADDFLLVSATANVRYHFDVFEGAKLEKLRPFLQGGMGISWLDDDRRNVDDTDFLLNMGLGAEYEMSDHVFLGSNIMFNTVPTRDSGDAFYWTWQFLSARYRF
jgi:hypothetical protein